jgi:hypothetical protein
MASHTAVSPSFPATHASTLGVCWIAYGLARLAVAVWLAIFAPTATVMFGALLARVSDPFTLMTLFHIIYTAIIVWSVVCGVASILAGLALLAARRSARRVALLAAFLAVSEIPLGTILGIYTLLILLPAGTPQPSYTH